MTLIEMIKSEPHLLLLLSQQNHCLFGLLTMTCRDLRDICHTKFSMFYHSVTQFKAELYDDKNTLEKIKWYEQIPKADLYQHCLKNSITALITAKTPRLFLRYSPEEQENISKKSGKAITTITHPKKNQQRFCNIL